MSYLGCGEGGWVEVALGAKYNSTIQTALPVNSLWFATHLPVGQKMKNIWFAKRAAARANSKT